ncbi:hypothetical protein JCM17136A_42490 [Phocaeicola sartorii JCM 17136 = DSM 21941]
MVLNAIRAAPELLGDTPFLGGRSAFKITGIDKAHSGHFKCGCYLNSKPVLCLEELGFLAYNF